MMRWVELSFGTRVQEVNSPSHIRRVNTADEINAQQAVFRNPSLLAHDITYIAEIYGTLIYQPGLTTERPKIAVEKIVYTDKLQETFRNTALKSKADIVKKLRGLLKNNAVRVEEIMADYESDIFNNYQLLRITVSSRGLEHSRLPTFQTYGMFAYGKGKLLYLNHANTNFEQLLWEERKTRAADLDPERLAKAFLLCKVREGNTRYPLVKDVRDILDYETKGYTVDREKLHRYRNTITAPHWEAQDGKKDLVFFALSGWMYRVETLVKITASFDKSSANIKLIKTPVEETVFKKLPNIIY
jgi:hypothetical protein